MFLSDLPFGHTAIVLQTPDSLPVKLFEMGCMPGEEIELAFYAPFQDPMCFNVQGTLISMRRDLAQIIQITEPDAR